MSDRGETALHRAAARGQTDIVRLLLQNGASIDSRSRTYIPHGRAIREGMYGNEVPIKQRADIEHDCGPGGTPLMQATQRKNETTVRLLLENGADPNTETEWYPKGNSLHRAVHNHYERFRDRIHSSEIKITRLLVAKGANLEARNADCITPLLLAVKMALVDMVTLLLLLGADPNSVEETTRPDAWVEDDWAHDWQDWDAGIVEFEMAMQLIEDAKQRWVEVTQSKHRRLGKRRCTK